MRNDSRTETERATAHNIAMGDTDFRRLSGLVEGISGIRMPEAKKHMLEYRLMKRLRVLGIRSFRDYYRLLTENDDNAEELVRMIDVVTTNKTEFFREPAHFSFLADRVLPGLLRTAAGKPVNLWSAGCSSGEEPYTLAMVLSEYARIREPFAFSILATDISTRMLEKAYLGVYEEEKITPVPPELRRTYLLRSRDRSRGEVRMAPEIRARVSFRRLNFLDAAYGIQQEMQVIFCRNVLIYFERRTQEQVINKFCRHLQPGGYLFLGHSETLSGLDVPLAQVGSTIYRKPA